MANYYVAVNGSNEASGAIGAPFKTFLKALQTAVAGDTVHVRGGTYGKDNAAVYSILSATTTDTTHEAESFDGGSTYHKVYRCFLPFQDYTAPGWSAYSSYTTNYGSVGNPITVKAYTGETPVLDCSGFANFDYANNSGEIPFAVYLSNKSYIVIDGLEIVGGIVNIAGGDTREHNPHDITIKNCNIHDVVCLGGGNPGMIKLAVATLGSAYNIYIYDNKIHDMYQYGYEDTTAADIAHFGALTKMAPDQYYGNSSGGQGYIEFKGNEVYNCPQVFFFKNAFAGPFDVYDNKFHDCSRLGMMAAGCMHMYHNLVWDISDGFTPVGWDTQTSTRNPGLPGDTEYDLLYAYAGAQSVVEYNTFVNLNSLCNFTTGHDWTIKNNVIFGLTDRVTGAGYNTMAYIQRRGQGTPYDTAHASNDVVNAANSSLQTVDTDYNAFITPYSDFQMVQRVYKDTNGTTVVEHYSASQAASSFGFDSAPNSVFTTQASASAIFTDPANDDYTLLSPATYPSMGYYAYSAPGAGTTYSVTGGSGCQVGSSMTLTVEPDANYTGTVTPATNGSGTFTPATLSWSAASDAKTLTYAPHAIGTHVLSFTSDPALTNPDNLSLVITYISPAAGEGEY